jgi:hypothetical protein
MPEDRDFPRFSLRRERYPVEDLPAGTQEMLGRLAASAHGAGNASVAANPSDPAFWMLLDGHTSTPVVYLEGCYICEDDEFAQMGMPLCMPCPACVRNLEICPHCKGTGRLPAGLLCGPCRVRGFAGSLGHIAADDTRCDECGYEHSPEDYDEEGLVTGVPREKALFVKGLKHRQ